VSFVGTGDLFIDSLGSVVTNGGSVLYYADGTSGVIEVDSPLTFTGNTTLVGVTLDLLAPITIVPPASLSLYTDNLLGPNEINGSYSLASYESYGLPTTNLASTAVQGQLQSTSVSTPLSGLGTGGTGETGTNTGTSSGPSTLTTSGSSSTGGVGSLDDLNQGSQLFSNIVPGSGGTPEEPFDYVAPVTPPTHAQPLPQQSDNALGGIGSGIFQTRTSVVVRHNGVNGIENGASSDGNPAIWYRTAG